VALAKPAEGKEDRQGRPPACSAATTNVPSCTRSNNNEQKAGSEFTKKTKSPVQHSTEHYSTVQYSTVQYSTVQHLTFQST